MSESSTGYRPLTYRSLKLITLLVAACYTLAGCSSAPVARNGTGPATVSADSPVADSAGKKVPLAPHTQSETIAEVTRDELETLPEPPPEPAPASPKAQEIAKTPAVTTSTPAPPAPIRESRQQPVDAPQKTPVKKPPEPVAAPAKTPVPPSQNLLPIPVKPEAIKSEPVEPEPVTLQLTLEDLPVSIQSWILDRPPSGETTCILNTPPLQMEDGAGGTPVSLQLTSDALVVYTRSNIDLSYEGSRITIGDHTFAFDAVSNDTNAVIRQKFPGVIKALDKTKLASVALGFWPTWPKSTLYQLQVPVEGFSQAYRAWQSCNELL